jgi:UDP-glucuronate decarboxylase
MHAEDGRVVSNFIMQALYGKNMTIYGDGSQTRSFCYVDDLVEGMIRMMNTSDDVTGPVNLGNPVEFPVIELAEIIRRLTGSSSEIIFQEKSPDDPVRRRPDICRAEKILGWHPSVALETGLLKTIAYFKTKGHKNQSPCL